MIAGAQGHGLLGQGLGPNDQTIEQADADGQRQYEGNDADRSAVRLSFLFLGSLDLLRALAAFGKHRPLFSFA